MVQKLIGFRNAVVQKYGMFNAFILFVFLDALWISAVTFVILYLIYGKV